MASAVRNLMAVTGGARFYTLLAVASRLCLALTTVYLATALSPHEFGQYAFVQITAGLTMQGVFGAFSNVISARMARAESPGALYLVPALLFGGLLALASVAVGLASDALSLTSLSRETIAITGFWMFALFAASIQLGQLLARGRYRIAGALALLQPVSYILLIVLFPTGKGEVAALYAAIAAIVPSAGAIAASALRRRLGAHNLLTNIREVARDYRQSVSMNLASLPLSIMLWLTLNAVAEGDQVQLASYGIANQVIGLFMFLPASLAGVAIPQLARSDYSGREQLAWRASAAFLGLSVLGAGVIFVLLGSPLVPPSLNDYRYDAAIGVVVAGFMAARAPLAWINQIDRASGLEAASLLIYAAVLALYILVSPLTSMAALVIRLAASVASLLLSVWLFRAARPGTTGSPPQSGRDPIN